MIKTEIGVQRYHATCELDPSGQWLSELEELPQVHSFGRTLGKAREYLIDALALWLDIPVERACSQIQFRLPELPDHIQEIVEKALAEREIADAVSKSASNAVTEAALSLVHDAHLSLRDAGEVLGLSHQRIQQLVSGAETSRSDQVELAVSLSEDLAESLRRLLPGVEKEGLGAIAGAVGIGLALAWIESHPR